MGHSFSWNGGSGIWALATHWTDLTTASNPAGSPPSLGDIVNFDVTGGPVTISGTGTADAVTTNGTVTFDGIFNFGTLVGSFIGPVPLTHTTVPAGATLTIGGLQLYGQLDVTGIGASLVDAGTLSLPGHVSLDVTNHASARLGGLGMVQGFLNSDIPVLTVDGTSTLEIGGAGGAAAGAMTIDAGKTVTTAGTVAADVVNLGTLTASGLITGGVTGAGRLVVDADGVHFALRVGGTIGAGQTVEMAQASAELDLASVGAMAGTILDFVPGQRIRVGQPVEVVSAVAAAGTTTLSLADAGGTVVGTLALAGTFAGNSFIDVAETAGTTDIVLARGTVLAGAPPAAPAGTAGSSFQWISTIGGLWGDASNWSATPPGPGLVPGVSDTVDLLGPVSGWQVVSGAGQASQVSVNSRTALSGQFNFVGLQNLASLRVLPAATLIAVAGQGGTFDVAGGGATAVFGTLSAPAAITLRDHGALLAAAMDLGNVQISVDATSRMEIGVLGTLDDGLFRVDTGMLAKGAGFSITGQIINNGTIETTGSARLAGTIEVGFGGLMRIDAGATLTLEGAVGVGNKIAFASNVGLLDLSGVTNFGATINGFSAGDTIVVAAGIDTVAFGADDNALTLSAGGTVVETLDLAGIYTGETFAVAPGLGGVLLTTNAAVQRDFKWAGGSGGWGSQANWTEVTLGRDPQAGVPGAQDTATIELPGGPLGTSGTITGAGAAAVASLQGTIALDGSFAFGALMVAPGATFENGGVFFDGGNVTVRPGGTVTSGTMTDLGTIAVDGVGALLTVGGTISLLPYSLDLLPVAFEAGNLIARNGGRIRGAAIDMRGAVDGGQPSIVTVDASSAIEIGSAGGAATGRLTVDADGFMSGAGQINANVTNNGTILVLGGFLNSMLVTGDIDGTGTLAIAIGRNLTLHGTAAAGQHVAFDGGGLLDISQGGALGPISGLAAGGTIMVAPEVAHLALSGAGTLDLSDGNGTGLGTLRVSDSLAGKTLLALTGPRDGAPVGRSDLVTTTIVAADGTVQSGPLPAAPAGLGGDAFTWLTAGGGAWGTAANWHDQADAAGAPAAAAPGVGDFVTLAAVSSPGMPVISGSGIAANVDVTGHYALSGSFGFGVLTIENLQLEKTIALDVIAGATVTAGVLTLNAALQASGAGSSIAVGTLEAGLSNTSPALYLRDHAALLAAKADLGSAQIFVDPTARLEFGGLGGLADGLVRVDSGTTVTGQDFSIAGHIENDGTIKVLPDFFGTHRATNLLGTLDGSGVVAVKVGATLALEGAVGAGQRIDLSAGFGHLDLTGAVNPAGTITGFVNTDTIVVPAGIDGSSFTPNAGTQFGGQLTLTAGGTVADVLNLAGDFSGRQFVLQAGTAGTLLTTDAIGPRTLLWVGGTGAWQNAVNWVDVTSGTVEATGVVPGGNDIAAIIPTLGVSAAVSGGGSAQQLSLSGTVTLTGAYTAETFTVAPTFVGSGVGTQPVPGGTPLLTGGGSIHAGSASLTGNFAMAGAGTTLDVEGMLAMPVITYALNAGSSQYFGGLAMTDHAAARVGGLDMEAFLPTPSIAPSISIDATSVLEVGTVGSAIAGALNVDGGVHAALAGTLDAALVNNGSVVVIGGPTAPVRITGAVSGSGTIDARDTGDMNGIAFAAGVGAAQTVVMGGTADVVEIDAPAAFAGTIDGFRAGETIALPSGITSATFASTGTGEIASLFAGVSPAGTIALDGFFDGRTFHFTPGGGGSAITLTTDPTTGHDFILFPNGTGPFAWSNGAVWYDTVIAAAPANGPDASNNVQLWTPFGGGSLSSGGATVTGGGASKTLLLNGVFSLDGSYDTGGLNVLASRGPGLHGPLIEAALTLTAGSTVSATGFVSSGPVHLAAGSKLDIAGAGELAALAMPWGFGFTTPEAGTLELQDHAVARVDDLSMRSVVIRDFFAPGSPLVLDAAHLLVDATSTLEIGTAGGAAAGVITVDAGHTLEGAGVLGAPVVNNGTILADISPGTVALLGVLEIDGPVSGAGTLEMSDGGRLRLAGGVSAGQVVRFAPSFGTLDLSAPAGLAGFQPGIGGFDAGDTIALPVGTDAVVYATGTAGHGSLVVSALGTPEATLDLAGTFDTAQFDLTPTGTATLLTMRQAAASTLTWKPLTDGLFSDAANWKAAIAGPDATTAVVLESYPFGTPLGGGPLVSISGGGSAASLVTHGTAALIGAYTIGAFDVLPAFVGLPHFGTGGSSLTLDLGATVHAQTATIGDVTSITGAGTGLTVDGQLVLQTTPYSVIAEPLPFGHPGVLGVADQAHVQVGALSLQGISAIPNLGANVSLVSPQLTLDGSATFEVGFDGVPQAGVLTIDANRVVDGAGVLAMPVANAGTVLADVSGLAMVLAGAVSGIPFTGGGVLEIRNHGTLVLPASVDATQTVVFDASRGALDASLVGDLVAPITGFGGSDAIIVGSTIDGVNYTPTGPHAGTLAWSAGGVKVGSAGLVGDYGAGDFTVVAGGTSAAMIELAAPCFATGTRIRTRRGEVAVERLVVGDVVINPWGEALPVVWIGHRQVAAGRHPRPWDVQPVRVLAGAFGPGRPARDLRLSPDHAVFVDGMLIPVRYLLNGATIRQEAVRSVTYWHVELERHDVLLAEGLECESYLDTGNRAAFANGGAAVQLHPDFARAAWDSQACGALVCAGARLAEVRARLLRRAGALGFATTGEAGLEVVVAGRPLEGRRIGGRLVVDLPARVRGVTLRSLSAVPAEMRAADGDHRRLGVAVTGVWLDGEVVDLDDRRLTEGWHAPEDGRRWTDGAARIETAGARRLTVETVRLVRYWAVSPAERSGYRRPRP